LTKFVHAFNGYFILNEYARSQGVTVINNTPSSFIDAFTRMDLEQSESSNNG
jgi:hypothetical protein